MEIFTAEIGIESADKTELIDVTDRVRTIVSDSGIKRGVVNIYTTHTTTSIRINENESGLIKDIKRFLEKNAPPFKSYEHDNLEKRDDVPVDEPANAHSHLKAIMMGASESIPIMGSSPAMGRWQRVFFVELDGPRKRKMLVNVMGER